MLQNGLGNLGDLTDGVIEEERRLRDMRQDVDRVESQLTQRTFTGSDRSRLVSVTLRRDGKIQDLRIAQHWRRRTTPTRLPDTVMAAFEDARSTLRTEVARAYRAAGLSRIAANVHPEDDDDDLD